MNTFEPVEAVAQADAGGDQPSNRLRVGDPLPARLLPEDMMRIFGVQKQRFYALVKAGRFDRFELKPLIGRRAWSGKLVQAYFDGESLAGKRA